MRAFLLALALAFCTVPAWATCSFRSISPVNFGVYDVFSAIDDDTTGSVTIRCTPTNEPYTLKLSAGASGSFAPRTLSSGTDRLNYNLYLDAARTRVWGDGSSGTSFYSDAGKGGGNNPTIYARLPAGQDPTVGAYTDTIVMLLEF